MPINIDSGVPTRVGIYARYSSDLQRPTSIDDQIRECRDSAARDGWTVLDHFIHFDEAKTGQLAGRDGLDALLKLALQSPRPFDGIVIDDTSRVGRNLSNRLPLSDVLAYAGVFLYFVNRRLDSRDPNFRTLFIAYGQQDEQQSRVREKKSTVARRAGPSRDTFSLGEFCRQALAGQTK